MPFEDDPNFRGVISPQRALNLRDPADYEAKPPSLTEQLGAAFDLDNTVVSVANALNRPRRAPEDDFDPLAHLQPGEELIAARFAEAKSPEEMEDIRKQLDRERDARRVLGDGPLPSIVATALATVLDPTSYLPVFGAAGKASTAARIGKMALGAAGDVAVSEAILQSTQRSRPIEESIAAILMGGAFGLGIGGAVARHQRVYERAVEDFAAVYRGAAEETGTVFPPMPESAGAAALPRLAPEDTTLAGGAVVRALTEGMAKMKGFVAPSVELSASPLAASREAVAHLVDTGLVTEGHVRGLAGPAPVELDIRMGQNVNVVKIANAARAGFRAYRKAGGTLSRAEFHEAIGRAMRRGDESPIPEIAKAARAVRTVFDQLKNEAIAAKLLPADVKVEEALSYFTRVYDVEKIKARRPEFHARVVAYLKRNTPKEELANESELDFMADQIVDTILGAPVGRTAAFLRPPNLRGPMKERTFHIPDEDIEDFLVNDVLEVGRRYVNTMVADTAMANLSTRLGFGGRADDVAEGLAGRIREEANAAAHAAKTEKERTAILDRAKREENLIRDLTSLIRGTDKAPADPSYMGLKRLARSARTLTYLRMLGSVLLSSIPDVARIVMEEGFTKTFGTLIGDMARGFKAARLAKDEAQLAGTALDVVLSTRARSMYDLGERYATETKLERALDVAGQLFGNITLMNPWNTALKSVTSVMVSTRILETAEKLAKGQKLTPREIRKLARSGISEDMALRIANEAEHWDRVGSAILANTEAWKDREAVQAFRRALIRDVDHTIITPGRGDAPLWTSTEWGKTLFQFKRFGMASTQRVLLSSLQVRDKETVSGIVMLLGLGALGTALRDITSDGEVKDRTVGAWINEGIDRSGILSMAYEMDAITDKFTGGNISLQRALVAEEASRFKSRDLVGQLAGPTAGTVSDLASAVSGVSGGDFTKSDLHKIRRLFPGQNHFLLRGMLDALEDKAARELDLPEKQPRKTRKKAAANLP